MHALYVKGLHLPQNQSAIYQLWGSCKDFFFWHATEYNESQKEIINCEHNKYIITKSKLFLGIQVTTQRLLSYEIM